MESTGRVQATATIQPSFHLWPITKAIKRDDSLDSRFISLKKTDADRNPAQATNDLAPPSLAILQERLRVQVQTLATQMEVIEKLEATVRATKRSLKIAWAILVATIILCVSIFVLLLLRS
jgi:hypothetical protein